MTANSPFRWLWRWVRATFLIFLALALVMLALPALLKVLNVPSFAIQVSPALWLLRWQNQPAVAFNLSFNPLTLGAIAAVIGLVETRGRSRRRPPRPAHPHLPKTVESPRSRRR